MLLSTRLLIAVAMPLAALPAASQDLGPAYADLRVQGGIVDSAGSGLAAGIVCGDLSEGERGQYAGLVLGIRACASSGWRCSGDGGEIRLKAAGGEALGGLGFTTGAREHLEILALVGGGVCGDSAHPGGATEAGHYRQVGGEIGWYHTFHGGWQLGATAGYSRFSTHLDNGPVTGAVSASGVAAAAVLGYRLQ
jgi:hypothetical protein